MRLERVGLTLIFISNVALGVMAVSWAGAADDVIPRVACVGDSLTASDYPKLLQEQCGTRCEVKSWAKKDAKLSEISVLFREALDSGFRPTHVVIYGGINDCNILYQHWKRIYDNIDSMVQLAKERGVIPIVVEHHGWAGKFTLGNQCSQLVNGRMYDMMDARLVNTSGMSRGGILLRKFDSGDGLHLNHKGYRELARLVCREVIGACL